MKIWKQKYDLTLTHNISLIKWFIDCSFSILQTLFYENWFSPVLPLPLMVLTDNAVGNCWLTEGQGEVGLKELLLITFKLFSPSNNLVLSSVHSFIGSTISSSVGGTWLILRLCSVFLAKTAPFVLSSPIALLFSGQQCHLPQEIRRKKFLKSK